MGIYTKSQQMMDEVCNNIGDFKELIGEKDGGLEKKYNFVPGIGNMSIQESALTAQLQSLEEGIFQVLFTGGFSSGKSTLLNALMRKEILRTSINAETAVITKVVFKAKEECITVYKKQLDNHGYPITENYTIEEFFEKYRVDQENPELFSQVDYVQLAQTQEGIGGSMVQLVDSPGTSNSEADTLAARTFAEKASAIVYLINATMPFQQEEKDYIKTHFADKEMKNLFFVVNRFDNVAPQQVPDLKVSVKEQLRSVFTFNGSFNESLFESRVFYTNAYGSMNARLDKDTPTPYGDIRIEDSKTGVPLFESALGRFLTDDNRDRDALSAYIPKLALFYSVAKEKVANEQKRYHEGLDKLEEDRQSLESSKVQIEKALKGIEDTCTNTARELLTDIKRDYDSYVASVENGWNVFFNEAKIKEIPFNGVNMFKLAFTRDEEKKRKAMEPIQQAIQTYLKSKEQGLQQSIADTLETKMAKLETSLEVYMSQLEELNCPIKINDIMKSIQTVTTGSESTAPDIKVNGFQLILGIVGADPEIALGALHGQKNNKTAILSSIGKNMFEYVALYIVAWPIGLAMLAKRGFDIFKGIKRGGDDSVKALLDGLKPTIIQELKDGKGRITMDMEKTVGGGIKRAGDTFSRTFKAELKSYAESFEKMIRELKDTNFNLANERERTDLVLKALVTKISNISELTKGVKLTEEDVLEISK